MNNFDEKKLPVGWEVKSLADIGNIFSGNSINAKLKEEKYSNREGTPYVATKDISYNSVINYDNGINIPFNDVNKFRLAKSETVLICAEGGSAGRKVGILNQDVYFVNKLFALETFSEVNSKFCFYWYLSKEFKSNFKDKLKGLIGGVSKTDFKKLPIPVPPLEEQKRIVAKIDNLFAKIDKAISLTEESLKQAENLLPSILKKVFEELKCEHIPLSKFCSNPKTDMVGGPFGSNLKATEYVDEGFPIIRLQNVDRFNFIEKNIKFVTEEKAQFLKSHSYEYGDIVLTKLGDPLGKCCIVNNICGVDRGVISADIVRIRIDEQVNDKDFVVAGINSEVVKNQLVSKTQGTTRPRVTLKELREMTLPKPTFQEQVKIGNKISQYYEMIKVTQTKLEAQLAYLKQLKSSILSKAFKGEL